MKTPPFTGNATYSLFTLKIYEISFKIAVNYMYLPTIQYHVITQYTINMDKKKIHNCKNLIEYKVDQVLSVSFNSVFTVKYAMKCE